MMRLSHVVDAVGGQLIGNDCQIDDVFTDTRQPMPNGLFIALSGDNFDAHDFVDAAFAGGAKAVLVERMVDTDLPQVLVDDSRRALLDLATWWRTQFSIPVIGVTGSVGKTTVKDMLACIMSEIGEGIATQGNLNNEIGVPLTLLRLRSHHLYAVIEMGMNHAGEISRLTRAAQPTVALVNNAAAAHLEGLGSVAAVAKAKGEIFEGLADDGVALINADDDYADLWRELAGNYQQLAFGLQNQQGFTASYKALEQNTFIQISGPQFDLELTLSAPAIKAKHNVANALAAVVAAHAAGASKADIATGLTKFSPAKGRLNIENIGGVDLIDDSYNANPESMRAAINVLAAYPSSTLIVGDMGELGDAVHDAHQEVGAYASAQGVSRMLACGEYAGLAVSQFERPAESYLGQEELISDLPKTLNLEDPTRAILVKGSRSARMEQVVQAARELLSSRESNLSEVTNAV